MQYLNMNKEKKQRERQTSAYAYDRSIDDHFQRGKENGKGNKRNSKLPKHAGKPTHKWNRNEYYEIDIQFTCVRFQFQLHLTKSVW